MTNRLRGTQDKKGWETLGLDHWPVGSQKAERGYLVAALGSMYSQVTVS